MKVDRALQLKYLEQLAEAYPETVNVQNWSDDKAVRSSNLLYLEEHHLVVNSTSKGLSFGPEVIMSKITARGIDFLRDDGGLTAVLGVVTVRLEAESIRALIADRLDAEDVQPEQRSRLKKALETMSTEALKTATKRLVEEALLRAPNAIQLLNTWLGSAG